MKRGGSLAAPSHHISEFLRCGRDVRDPPFDLGVYRRIDWCVVRVRPEAEGDIIHQRVEIAHKSEAKRS